MLIKNLKRKNLPTFEEKKRIIDHVTRLYVSLFKQGTEISPRDINILYSLLTNIFKKENISWEAFIRDIIKDHIIIEQSIVYLNERLSSLDKIRILLSLISMSKVESHSPLQNEEKIFSLAQKLDLQTEGFREITRSIIEKKNHFYALQCHIDWETIENSIFGDYLCFGCSEKSEIRFRDKSINDLEFILFMIHDLVLICTHHQTCSSIDHLSLEPNKLYFVPESSMISVNKIDFYFKTLLILYQNQSNYDVKRFIRQAYDIKLCNNKNRLSILMNQGSLFRNGFLIPRNRNVSLFYDDIFQLKGYGNFPIFEFIHSEEEVGIDNSRPKELFIDYNSDFYTLTRVENNSSLLKIEVGNTNTIFLLSKRMKDIYLNNNKLTEPREFHLNTDIITINKRNFRINIFYDLVEIPFDIEQISILDLKHHFPDGSLAIDSISWEAKKGELVGILGASGCGKTSLIKILNGEILPNLGTIHYDGKDFFQNYNFFSQFIGYVPQEDLLFSNLTVYENLYYRGKLHFPRITNDVLNQKIENILLKINLLHKKYTKVGQSSSNILSGGERKRINLALELLFDPAIILCDEPTSGLSYLDAEQIIDILQSFVRQGRIVILSIHQPNTNVFHRFHKILLMDMGGKQVFYGSPNEVWTYFDEEYRQIKIKREQISQKKIDRQPEYISFVVEYPDYKDNGEVTYEKIAQNIMVKRKFSPNYWRDKYKKKILYELISHRDHQHDISKVQIPKKEKKDFYLNYKEFITFFTRNMVMKLRNGSNLLITFGQAILLGLIIAFILRLAPPNADYSFYQNSNLGIYIFISIIIFIFFGMSNSMEEIVGERKNFIREKMLNINLSLYLTSKIAVLGIFSLFQVLLYSCITNQILLIKGCFSFYFLYFWAASLIGSSLGVLVSCFLKDLKSVINIIPLILIPQIIFCGALVEFEKMNTQVTIIKNNPIPEVVQIMPSYYLFEGLFTAQAKANRYENKMRKIEHQKQKLLLDPASKPSDMTKIYSAIESLNTNYPKKIYTNEYNSLTVNLKDGKFLNSHKNVFLSSMKKIGKVVLPTYLWNLLVIFLLIVLINLLSIMKLKFFSETDR